MAETHMKKMASTTDHYGNANQNHNERPPHTYQDVYYPNRAITKESVENWATFVK